MAFRNPQPCDTIYISNLPVGTTEDSLCEFLVGTYGATILWKKFYEGKTGSVAALVQFDSIEKATEIKDALHNTQPEGANEPVCVRFKEDKRANQTPQASQASQVQWTETDDNLYMQNLPQGTDKEILDLYFSEFGQITSYKILDSGTAGLVRFASSQQAQTVIAAMNGKFLHGATSPLIIRLAEKKSGNQAGKGNQANQASQANQTINWTETDDNLYMLNLPPGTDKEMLELYFSEFGQITSYKMLDSGTAGLVRFASPEQAQTVISAMNGKFLHGATSPLIIRLAEKKSGKGKSSGNESYGKGQSKTDNRSGPYAQNEDMQGQDQQIQVNGGKGGPSVTGAGLVNALMTQNVLPDSSKLENDCFVVYVCGLPVDFDELLMYKMFAPFGSVLSVCVQRKKSQQGTDFLIAFVNFGDQAAAENAINTYNQLKLPNGGFLKVTHKPNKQPQLPVIGGMPAGGLAFGGDRKQPAKDEEFWGSLAQGGLAFGGDRKEPALDENFWGSLAQGFNSSEYE